MDLKLNMTETSGGMPSRMMMYAQHGSGGKFLIVLMTFLLAVIVLIAVSLLIRKKLSDISETALMFVCGGVLLMSAAIVFGGLSTEVAGVGHYESDVHTALSSKKVYSDTATPSFEGTQIRYMDGGKKSSIFLGDRKVDVTRGERFILRTGEQLIRNSSPKHVNTEYTRQEIIFKPVD